MKYFTIVLQRFQAIRVNLSLSFISIGKKDVAATIESLINRKISSSNEITTEMLKYSDKYRQ